MNAKCQAIYNNCVRNAENTHTFWQKVADFLNAQIEKNSLTVEQALEIYNALEVYILYANDKRTARACCGKS